MDGNLWAGSNIMKEDERKQNRNGKLFENFLSQNSNLSVVNALPICKGKFTRVRRTIKGIQESMIDFFVVCEKNLPLVTNMTIDEK